VSRRRALEYPSEEERKEHDRYRECRGESADQVLAAVISAFSRHEDWFWAHAEIGAYRRSHAYAYRPPGTRELLFAGNGGLAAELSQLVAGREDLGWSLMPVEPARTPLEELWGVFKSVSGSVRHYNLLRTQGFAYAEELAVVPDACLLDFPRGGTQRLVATVHQVLAELGMPHACSVTVPACALAPARARPYLPERVEELEQRVVSLEELANRLRDELMTLCASTGRPYPPSAAAQAE
jgi:hypothetical protein